MEMIVARMERSDIRELRCNLLGRSRISLALNPGYKRSFLQAPDSAEPQRRPGG